MIFSGANILFWGLTIGTIGKVLLVLAVLHMHHSLIVELGVDKKVILSYQQERVVTFIGLVLIVLGYSLEVYFYAPTNLFNCVGIECTAGLINSVSP
jgi:hypothetical protein